MVIERPANERHSVDCSSGRLEAAEPLAYAFENFAKAFATVVAGQLCAPIDVGETTAVIRPGLAALQAAATEGHVTPLGVEPAKGGARLVLGRQFAGWAADMLLGAPLVFAGESREFLTDLDQRSIDTLIEAVPAELGRAFGPIFGATFVRVGRDAVASQRAGEDSPVLVLTAELKFAEATSSVALILPMALAGADPDAQTNTIEGRARIQNRMLGALSLAVVEVEAVLKGSDMRLGDLVRLRPGMVLALPQKAGAPLECQINGVTKFSGEMTRSGGSAGLVIQSIASQLPGETRGSVRN